MMKLNLLSPEQKNLFNMIKIYKMIENFVGILVLCCIIIAIVLVPLNQNAIKMDEQNQSSKKQATLKNQAITQKINGLNSRITSYKLIMESVYSWNSLLYELAGIVPDNIVLNRFNSSSINKQFIIRGFAKTRDDLILFIENLNTSNSFINIDSPLSNYLIREDISFEIKGNIK